MLDVLPTLRTRKGIHTHTHTRSCPCRAALWAVGARSAGLQLRSAFGARNGTEHRPAAGAGNGKERGVVRVGAFPEQSHGVGRIGKKRGKSWV